MLGLVAAGCGGGSEPTSPGPTAPADSSSRIGAGGGSVTVGLADGGSATLTIPAQAIGGDTVIRIQALAPAAGEQVRLRVEPAGLLLRSAATIAVTLPGAPVADAAIVLRGAAVNVTLATTVQGRTLSATSRVLGLADPPSRRPALQSSSRVMALADGDDSEIIVTAVAVQQRVQQLDALIAKVNNEPAAVAAIWVNLQLAALAQSGAPAAQFLNNARVLICQQYFDRLRDFNQDVMDQPGDFTLGLRRVFTWVSALNAAGLQDNCPQGLVAPDPVIAAKSVEFFAYLQQRINSIDFERDFVQFYEAELILQLQFAEALQLLGVAGTDEISVGITNLGIETFNRLRPAAFNLCFNTPPGGFQRFPGLLYDAANSVADLDATTFSGLLRDIQYCATALEYDIERNGRLEAFGPLGRNAGNFMEPFTADVHTISYGGTFDLRGDMRALRCLNGAFSNDTLVLAVGTRRLRVLPQAADGRLMPAGGVQIPTDSIAVAGGLIVGRAGSVTLGFVRSGTGCRNAPPILGTQEESLASLRLNFNAGLRISTSETLADATIGEPYSAQLAATGADGPISWRVAERRLPPGLTLSSAGAISGTPTGEPDLYSPRIEATSVGVTVDQIFTIRTVAPQLRITTETFPTAFVGTPFNLVLTTSGATGPVTFSSAGLPAGLTLSSGGVVSGTPTLAQSGTVAFTATSNGAVGTRAYPFVVRPALAIVPGGIFVNLPDTRFTPSLNVSVQLGTNGDPGGPVTFSLVGGTLPVGTTLSANGLISGRVTAAGTPTITVQAVVGSVVLQRVIAVTYQCCFF